MNAHIVYAGLPHNNLNYAPFTITRNLYRFLSQHFEKIHYYDWCYEGPLAPVLPNDIILGHPNYPANTALRKLFQSNCKLKCLVFPFHHAIPEINLPFDDLVSQANVIFSITGQYWYDTISQSRFAHWKKKMVRVDMAIDTNTFPYVKTKFNPKGKRSFFYIGCDRPEKGLNLLFEIMRRVPYQMHTYGNISHPLIGLPNVHHHGWTQTSPQWASDLANIADCFLNTSISDANATTLLEAMAWGFPVGCTPQSGYYNSPDILFGMNPNDVNGCVNLLQFISDVDESYLIQRSQYARKIIENNYTWDKFCRTIWDKISQLM